MAVDSTQIDEGALEKLLADAPGQHYAILDACDEPAVLGKVLELREKAVSLYRGKAEYEFAEIAPYLVEFDQELLDWIRETLWEKPWGVVLGSSAELEELRTHFRRFLKVEDPEGKELFFRFYDPRVLPTFLKSCNGEEILEFFGPVTWYAINDGETLTQFVNPDRIS